MKFIVAEIQGGIDGFEGFEVNVQLPLLSLVRDYVATRKSGWSA